MRIEPTMPAGSAVKRITFFCVFVCFAMMGCTGRNAAPNNYQRRLNDKEAQELLFSKDSIPFWFFTTKAGVDFSSAKQKISFNATVKMKIDSAFCGTMTVGPVLGGTYLINQDSVHFANKRQRCFIKADFSGISDLFGTTIEYSFFQELVLGLPIGLDPEVKYNSKNTKEYYVLSSFKKRDLRHVENVLEGDRNIEKIEDNIFVQYYVNTETWHLDRISIQVPADTVEIEVNYLNRQPYEGFYLPEETTIQIVHPRDSIVIGLDYGNIELNDRKTIDINIPGGYEECKP